MCERVATARRTISAASVLVRGPSSLHFSGSTFALQNGLFLWLRKWNRSTTILTELISHLAARAHGGWKGSEGWLEGVLSQGWKAS